MSKIIEISHVQVAFRKEKGWNTVLHDSSFEVYEDEIVGIVGESGSGKSITSLAIMGLLPKGVARIAEGSILFRGVELVDLEEKAFRKIRGKEVGMIFQEPMSSLNPSMKCGAQVEEVLREHTALSASDIKKEVLTLFDKVKLPNPDVVYTKYPHELSGGQKQRVMIAMAIACKPSLLIADEPTTALDVTVQEEIIALLKELQQETKMSIIFITHDLSLISKIAQRVVVMYQGNIVEQGATADIFNNPRELYTQALLKSRPTMEYRQRRLSTVGDFLKDTLALDVIEPEERSTRLKAMYATEPLLRVVNVEKEYLSSGMLFSKKSFRALKGVSLEIYEGETLGLVGESGCGKSTLGNVILQLDKATKGQVFYKGVDLTLLDKKALRMLRKEIQIIFQDPYSSLNPKMTVGESIMEPMIVHKMYSSAKERKEKVVELLKAVGLDEASFRKYPHEFSGGQRQRVGIARTIALQPKLIVCDESVSALDISVQAQVLNLLNDLKEEFGFTYLFISHDLSVVKYMSDAVIVMNKGLIEEYGEADSLYENPQTEYTKKLIASIPN